MSGRIAVFVDAGYFQAMAGAAVNGRGVERAPVRIDHARMREEFLAEAAAALPSGSLLRVNWYDAPGADGRTAGHSAIDRLDDFKLRMGTRNSLGQQKGVDGMLITDLLCLSHNGAISDAMLVTGDADMIPAVQASQGMGVRIHLLSIFSETATSPVLAAEADRKILWGASRILAFAGPFERDEGAGRVDRAAEEPAARVDFEEAVRSALARMGEADAASWGAFLADVDATIPGDADRILLGEARALRGGARLSDEEKNLLRKTLRRLARPGIRNPEPNDRAGG